MSDPPPPPAAAPASPARSCCAAAPPPPAAACARSSPACRCPPAPACRGARSWPARSGLALAVFGGAALSPRALEAGIAAAQAAGEERILVSIFCSGGLDSLSLLAPVGDSRYAALRGSLALPADSGLHVRRGLAPALAPAAPRRCATSTRPGKLTVIPAIGYDDPNQSHFTSRHYWEVGAIDPSGRVGWLGRYLDRHGAPTTRCRASRSTTRSRPRWRPATCRWRRCRSPSSYDAVDARPAGTPRCARPLVTRWGAQDGIATSDPELATARRAAGMSATLRTSSPALQGHEGAWQGAVAYPRRRAPVPRAARLAGRDDRPRAAAAGRRARRQRRLRHAREPGRDADRQPRRCSRARWPPSRPTSRRAGSPTACSCTCGASSAAARPPTARAPTTAPAARACVMGTRAVGHDGRRVPRARDARRRGQPAPHRRLPRASTAG